MTWSMSRWFAARSAWPRRGAVWLTQTELVVTARWGCFRSTFVVLLDPTAIVDTMHDRLRTD